MRIFFVNFASLREINLWRQPREKSIAMAAGMDFHGYFNVFQPEKSVFICLIPALTGRQACHP